MKFSKKITLIITIFIITTLLIENLPQTVYANSDIVPSGPIKVAVILSNFDNDCPSAIHENLNKIQEESDGKVNFTFFDGKGDQVTQNKIIDSIVENHFHLLLANLVDKSETTIDSIINKVKQKNIPIILFNLEPFITNSIKSYGKALVIATDVDQSGVLEGNLVTSLWKSNKKAIDKNGDNALQYVLLTGKRNNTVSTTRAQHLLSTINKDGIKTQQLALRISDETEHEVRSDVQSLLMKHGFNSIEAIITTNDRIAISAIKELQEYGYNKGDKLKTIPVFGINGTSEAIELIQNGFMAGTVVQDIPAMTQALYTIGVNLVYGKNPLEGTPYKFDETGSVIKIPYYEYKNTDNLNEH